MSSLPSGSLSTTSPRTAVVPAKSVHKQIFRALLIHLSAPGLDPFRAALAGGLAPFIFPVLSLMVVIAFLECILNAEGQFGWPAYAGLLVPLTTAALVLMLGRSNGVFILCIG